MMKSTQRSVTKSVTLPLPMATSKFSPRERIREPDSRRKNCLRLRGLPYDANVNDILRFLGEYSGFILLHGVHLVFTPEGQPSGEAFIELGEVWMAHVVAGAKHHLFMQTGSKRRYIEVFQCSADDMNLILTGHPPTALPSSLGSSPIREPSLASLSPPSSMMFAVESGYPPQQAFPAPNFSDSFSVHNDDISGIRAFPFILSPQVIPPKDAVANGQSGFQGFTGGIVDASGFYWPIPTIPVSPQRSPVKQLPASPLRNARIPGLILLRGVPSACTHADVVMFLRGFEIRPGGIQFQNSRGGVWNNSEVIVQLASREEAERAVLEKNRHLIGMNPINVFIFEPQL